MKTTGTTNNELREAAAIELLEIGWMKGAPAQGEHIPDYVTCDLCDGSCVTDFMHGAKESRRFFQQRGGNDDGLIVCEECINEFLSEIPS